MHPRHIALYPSKASVCAKVMFGPWADRPPQLPNNLGLLEDGFWEDNEVRFPGAWPEKLTLPVAITDLSNLPVKGKYYLLALEETVLAFWRFVEHCLKQKSSASTELHKLVSEGGGGAEGPSSEGASSATIFAQKKEELTKNRQVASGDGEGT